MTRECISRDQGSQEFERKNQTMKRIMPIVALAAAIATGKKIRIQRR